MFTIPFAELSSAEITDLAARMNGPDTPEWEKYIWSFVADWYNPSIESIEVRSSGSTGKPKAIHHTKEAMLAHAGMTCETLQLKKGSTAWLCLPANKIGGMMMIVRCIYNDMNLLCTKPLAAPFERLSPEAAISFAALTPMQMKSTDTDYSWYRRMNTIDTILLGGETVGSSLIRHLQAAENKIYSTFGMTETISHIALRKINGNDSQNHYTTLKGVTVTQDERGCLVVNAPSIDIHHLVTNDMAEVINEHEFVWLGRTDNVINTGGIKVFPESIEQKLQHIIDVPFFVAALPDEVTGQQVVIILEATKIDEKQTEILKRELNSLPKYEKPKTLLLIESFARTDNGKIKRSETMSLRYNIIPLN